MRKIINLPSSNGITLELSMPKVGEGTLVRKENNIITHYIIEGGIITKSAIGSRKGNMYIPFKGCTISMPVIQYIYGLKELYKFVG